MKKLSLSATTIAMILAGTTAYTPPAAADFLDQLQVRVRGIAVVPEEDSTTTIGGSVKAGNAMVPELDFTYFFNKYVGAELILATSPHDMSAENTGLGNVDLGDVWILPPTLTLQIHPMPDSRFRPYFGGGVNYTIFYNEDPAPGSPVTAIDYDDGFGYAAQAGFDFAIDDHWAVNFDVKKVWLPVDVSLNGGAITADVDLDPWIFGMGLTYRFGSVQ